MMKFFHLSIVLCFLAVSLAGAPVAGQENSVPTVAGSSDSGDAGKLERTKAIIAGNSAPGETRQAVPSEWKSDVGSGLQGIGLSMGKSLLFCLGIFLIGIAIYRRFSPRTAISDSRRIRIVERASLSHRTALALIEVDGRRVLISSGQDCVSFLDLETDRAPDPTGFEKSLKEACVTGS